MEVINIRLDFTQKVPLTEQISNALRRLIREGMITPGDPLPTVRELAAQLGVNFNTTARAYRTLDIEGLITTRQGRGTFVRAPIQETDHGGDLERQSEEGQAHVSQRLEQWLDDFLDRILIETTLAGISNEMLQHALQKRMQGLKPMVVVSLPAKIRTRKHRTGNKRKRTDYGLDPLPARTLKAKRRQTRRTIHK